MIVSANSSTRAGGLADRGDRNPPDKMGSEPRHHPQILGDERADLRPLHLDHHPLAGDQFSRMDLGDGRGGQRRVVDPGEHRTETGAEFLFDHLLDGRPWLGADLIAAALELGDQLGGKQAITGGNDLPELDVGRSELFCGASES